MIKCSVAVEERRARKAQEHQDPRTLCVVACARATSAISAMIPLALVVGAHDGR